jgi:hypothetical protein
MTTVVRFDAPDRETRTAAVKPAVLGRLLKQVGLRGPVDVLGLS